jgi:hypothetical protein
VCPAVNGAKEESDGDNEGGSDAEFTEHDKGTGAPGSVSGHPEKKTAEAVKEEERDGAGDEGAEDTGWKETLREQGGRKSGQGKD